MPTRPRRIAATVLLLLVATLVLACDTFERQGSVATGVLIVDPGPNPSTGDFDDARDAVQRYAAQTGSRLTAVTVIDRLGLDEDAANLVDRISVTGSEGDPTLRLEVRDDDPAAARSLVLALGDTMIERVEAELLGMGRVRGEAVGEETTVQVALQRHVDERFADVVEAAERQSAERPVIVRNRLQWLEKPRPVAAD